MKRYYRIGGDLKYGFYIGVKECETGEEVGFSKYLTVRGIENNCGGGWFKTFQDAHQCLVNFLYNDLN